MKPDFSMEDFQKKYQAEIVDLSIKARPFKFFVPKSLDGFVDPDDVFDNFPLWAKIWEASIVLAEHLAGIPPEPGKTYLEIGCGVGVVGVVASAFGHKFVSTEFNPDAIAFCRANSELNYSPDHKGPEIEKLDWNNPATVKGPFDTIVGSEVIYNEKDFEPIFGLFKTFLKPTGEIILAERVRKTSIEFFQRMGAHFKVTGRKKVLRSKDKEVRVLLCSMKFL
ncbi:methyltransferase [Thermodesulfobacteriota bacterium]